MGRSCSAPLAAQLDPLPGRILLPVVRQLFTAVLLALPVALCHARLVDLSSACRAC